MKFKNKVLDFSVRIFIVQSVLYSLLGSLSFFDGAINLSIVTPEYFRSLVCVFYFISVSITVIHPLIKEYDRL